MARLPLGQHLTTAMTLGHAVPGLQEFQAPNSEEKDKLMKSWNGRTYLVEST